MAAEQLYAPKKQSPKRGDALLGGYKTNSETQKGPDGKGVPSNPRYGQKFRQGVTKDGKVVHVYANGKRIVLNKKATLLATARKKASPASGTGGVAAP